MLQEKQVRHIVTLLKQKFISPYKIIYMIDQKQADRFKARNKNVGCCTSAEVTIQAGEQTKMEKQLAALITPSVVRNYLPQLLGYCQDRYKSIVEKGKNDNLKITAEVQKYLIDNIMAEAVNKFIHGKLVTRIAQESRSLSSEIGLWATPATWHAKYPHIKLELFESRDIAELFGQGYATVEGKFDHFLVQIGEELLLLEKDGRFQQILWKNQEKPQGNEHKILKNPLQYGSLEPQNTRFRNIARACILLQSIPFELNMKANSYLTISDSIQVYYYNGPPTQAKRKTASFKYELLVPVNIDLTLTINQKEVKVRKGNIFITANLQEFQFQCQESVRDAFIIRSYISEAHRNK